MSPSLTPDEYKRQQERACAQAPRSVVVCMRPAQVNWTRLPDTVARQLLHTTCADCHVAIVWSPRSSPDEPLKVCDTCARQRMAAEQGRVKQVMYLGPETAPPQPGDGQHRQ